MKVFKGTCEIALSKADLTHAMWLWVKQNTMAGSADFRVACVTQHPGNKFVVRITVEPPAVAKAIEQAANAKPVTIPDDALEHLEPHSVRT